MSQFRSYDKPFLKNKINYLNSNGTYMNHLLE